jgi:uncharacterized DUF497 family protein
VEVVWDEEKSARNVGKHDVSFEEASRLFTSDADYLELYDEAHSITEERFIAIGAVERGIVLIVWTERHHDVIRIISARWATPREKALFQNYMEQIQ